MRDQRLINPSGVWPLDCPASGGDGDPESFASYYSNSRGKSMMGSDLFREQRWAGCECHWAMAWASGVTEVSVKFHGA